MNAYIYIVIAVMRLLTKLNPDKVRSLGLRKLRDSLSARQEYTLLKEGKSGRMLLVDSSEYTNAMKSTQDYQVFDKDFLKTPDGIFKIIFETPESWLVEGDDSPETILKPVASNSKDVEDPPEEVFKASGPAYSLGELMHPDDSRLRVPPYDSMNSFLWRKALDMTPRNSSGKVLPINIMKSYKKLKYK